VSPIGDPAGPAARPPRRRSPGRLLVTLLMLAFAAKAPAAVAVYGYEVVHTYPHDRHAFTEGLFYLDGFLYESTGLEGQSTIRKVRPETGAVVQRVDLPQDLFGEGIVNVGRRLVSLTYRTEVGFVRALDSFKVERRFSYRGEGWGLTQDGQRIIMSDGTSELRFLDPVTLAETGRLAVRLNGRPLANLNELEWIRGEIYANVWQTDFIVRIDPASGEVRSVIDLSGLLPAEARIPGETDVLNGIAYDARSDRLFVTGKNWPYLYEIRPSIRVRR
jgi:glutaminyl-peptide cyclotransferase